MLETPVNRLERDLQLLSRTSALLNAPLDWEKAVHQVIRLAAEALGGTVLFMIRDADQRSLQIFDYHHPDPAMRARYAEFWSRHPVAFPHGPTSQAMAAARTILIDTADPPPGIIEAYRAELGVEWYMAVPILSRGETLGMLGVHSTDRARPFSEHDRQIVQAIADQAANAMANARFLDHEVRLRQRAETLLKVAKAMRSELELPVVLQDVLDLTWQLLQAEFVGLFLSAPDRSLSLVASTELDASLQAAPWARLGPDSGLHRLLEAGHPGFETFLDLGSLWPDRPDLSRKTVPCAAVPILQQPRPSGLLLISWPEAHPPRPEDDRPLITGIAELIELSIEHQRLIQREAESHTERLLAEEVAKEREALIRQIVHDLRNSTQAISLINEEIELAAGGHPEILLGVSAIDRQITFISNFLKEKLAWMKQLHGQQRPAQTDLMPLLQRISRQFAPRFALRQQRFETPLGADQVEVPVSDVQLEQMVGNLLDNAQKYANPGATVKLWCALSDGWATLYVSDDGPGIAVDHQPRIGEIGFRGHPDVEGSGLGLANVKKLVTSNGGLFGFTSRPGVGSTFYVTLPTSRWGKA